MGGLVAALVVAAPDLRADQTQRETRERGVIVGVLGADGKPIANLAAADFTIREDGRTREVLRVDPAPPPSHVALLVDDSQATRDSIMFLRPALTAFIRRLLSGQKAPEVGLWTFGERPTRRADFSPNSAQAERAIERIFALEGSGGYLMEAIQEVARELRKRKADRPVIVAYVDERGPEFSNLLHKNVGDALKQADASLWTITRQARDQNMNVPEARERAMVLGDVTGWSGGANRVVLTPQALDAAFMAVGDELIGRLLVTYVRPELLVPPERLEVEVGRPNTRLRVTRWAGQ
jgi:hypothetical protein